MIAKITGILDECELTEIVVDVNGVGYGISIPLSTYEKLPAPGGKVTLYTHLHTREDCQLLYGFLTREERSLFRLLTSTVSGIGPKLALNILSSMSVEGFAAAVANSDGKTLGKINGIGKRTAGRILLELKDKLGSLSCGSGTVPEQVTAGTSQAAADATAALETLGFKHDAAAKAVQNVMEQESDKSPTAEQLIRKALSLLNS